MMSNIDLNRIEVNENPDELMINWLTALSDSQADSLLIEKVSFDMRNKLAKKRSDGYGGWHTAKCSNKHLIEMLKNHLEKGDMVDVLNIAGMILCRQSLYKEVYFPAR